MGDLVNARERREGELRAVISQTANDLARYLAVDVEPAAHIPGEMRARGTEAREQSNRPDAVLARQAASDHVECAQTPIAQLEDGRRVGDNVAVHLTELM